MKLFDLNQTLAETNAELDRIRDEIAALPAFQRGSPRHMDLSAKRQELLRQRENLRGERQRLFART
ncbi:MAG: hypothetical protein ACLQGP_03225 [Isosphaeraceae bacterium]